MNGAQLYGDIMEVLGKKSTIFYKRKRFIRFDKRSDIQSLSSML